MSEVDHNAGGTTPRPLDYHAPRRIGLRGWHPILIVAGAAAGVVLLGMLYHGAGRVMAPTTRPAGPASAPAAAPALRLP